MKLSRILIIIIVVVIIGIVALFAYEALVESTSSSSSSLWLSAAGYPIQVDGNSGVGGQQCVNSTSYIYCVGGQDLNGGPRSEAYTSSSISSSSPDITSWSSDSSPYPQTVNGQSCVTYGGDIYCVGGTIDDGGDDTAASYYAPLASDGAAGPWNQTTSYPVAIDTQYCVASSSGFIYCIGGNNETDGTNADSATSNSVWFAQLSSSGIGNWTQTTPYPADVYLPSCFAYDNYVYCLGGADSNNNALNNDYYAALTPSGVGTWTSTTPYPQSLTGQACTFSSGDIYCVGGEISSSSYTNAVYFAPASPTGIGSWKQGPNYPLSIGTTCAESSGYLYCVGGFNASSAGESNETYYASLGSLSTTTSTG